MTSHHGRGAAHGELAIDLSRFMDGVCEEVTELMLEGVHRSASLCASLCAERILAARGEMQRRWQEERQALDTLLQLRPRQELGDWKGPALPHPAPSAPAPARQPETRQRGEPAPRANVSMPFSAAPTYEEATPPSPPPKGAALGGPCATMIVEQVASAMGSWRPPAVPCEVLPKTDCSSILPGAQYSDSPYESAHDAVQVLEEKTSQACYAMDLLDAALNAAGATLGPPPRPRGPPYAGGRGGVAAQLTNASPPKEHGVSWESHADPRQRSGGHARQTGGPQAPGVPSASGGGDRPHQSLRSTPPGPAPLPPSGPLPLAGRGPYAAAGERHPHRGPSHGHGGTTSSDE